MSEIHLFDKSDEAVTYAAGQVVFREGDPAEHMYAVVSGAVEVSVHGKAIDTIGAGSVFGEMALIEDRPRSATVIAKEESRLVPITRQRFMFLVQQTPFFALQLMSIMAERLRKMDERV